MSGEHPKLNFPPLDWPRLLVRLFLGVIFVWAGTEKIAHPADFFSSLQDYNVPFPNAFLRLVAVVLPWLELGCGAALIANIWAETVRPLAAGLCLCFIAMVAEALLRGIDLSNCGCFGPIANHWIDRPAVALLRAILLFGASLYIMAPRAGAAARE
jgi:uncharacterized membrane protein YphA (DoxX/SURF4 family)